MLNSHFIGEITEQQVATEFLKLGILVSKPLVQSSRYDFIVDINHKLYKIQVKTGTFKEDAYLEFATSTSHTNTRGTVNHSYTENEIDYFATFYNNQCYIISVNECGSRNQRLRIKPPKNGNQRGSKMAENYTLEKFIDTLND